MGGWMTISTWFWRSGLGPGPSGGTGLTRPKGLAGPAMRKGKNTPTASIVPSARSGVVCAGEGEDVDREDRAPEEDRSLERAPQRHHRVDQRGCPASDLRHVVDAEVVGDQRADHHQIRAQHADQEGGDGGQDQADGARAVTQPALDAHHRTERRGEQPPQDRERSEGGVHRASAVGAETVVFHRSGPSPGLGGRYSLEWFTIRREEVNVCDLSNVPSTTTPMRSRNICGGVSRDWTRTEAAPGLSLSATRKVRWVWAASQWRLPGWTMPPSRMVGP